MKRILVSIAMVAGLFAGQPTLAAAPVAPAVTPAVATPALARLTASDAEAWIDGYLPYALKRGGIPGAVVVIVKDGQILFEKGYGTSDLATGAPVDPKKTLFRPGSVSKLFTWTAVMQQVEAGKIDLDADINTYLDFKIPPFEGKPVTLRNIMTHSGGFEEVVKNIMVGKPADYMPFEQVLKHWVPARVFPAGAYPAYSNYATTLAGYIVQRVSGEAFNDYIAAHILKPLGMNNATFVQPLPAALAPQMSKGYYDSTRPKPAYELVSMAPAGALAASGEDMGRFMIAHLQRGSYNGAQILKPETADLMHATALQVTPPLNGMALGLMELSMNGQRVIGHGGDTEAFHTMLAMYTASNVGIYISLNAGGREGASMAVRYGLLYGFADRYFPPPPEAPATVDAATAKAHALLLAGSNYVTSRASSTSFMKFTELLGQQTFTVNDDGTISSSAGKDESGAAQKWREVKPFVWEEVGGHRNQLAAVVKDGKVVMWAMGVFAPIMVFLPVPPLESAKLLLPLFGAALALLLLTVLAWPFTAMVRRRYGAAFPLTGARATGYRLSRLAALLALIGIAVVAWPLIQISNGLDGIEALSHQTGLILAIEALVLVGWIGGLLAALYNLYAVLTRPSGWFAKLWSLVLVLAFAVLAWVAIAFNLVNFSTNF